MQTETLERESAKFLSIISIAKDQKIYENSNISVLLNTVFEFIDEDLQLFMKLLNTNNSKDLMEIFKNRFMRNKSLDERLKIT